ncbi:hypothetical protein POV27_03555 [Aureisphaera galaxeae]|uniref:hypothetical protein n=1 Tax=Aureisphaera galaxeae TaxID=1538023 RepID=UPI002350FDEE|nr:hypothetical protein [Aureisphaera galaxeae]MDC8003110.1 hypothetical protein [Aureisphaera galaxeae]
MFWYILFGGILLLVIYLLFIPIILHIDTEANTYYLQLKGLAKANIEGDERDVLRIKLRVPFYTFYFYPLRQKKSKRKEIQADKKKKKHTRKRAMKWSAIRRVIRTFKVKKLFLDLDTGDNVLNAKLYPVIGLLNLTRGSFNINFEGRNQFMLRVSNRPIAIITSFINL